MRLSLTSQNKSIVHISNQHSKLEDMWIVGLIILLHIAHGTATDGDFNLTWASLGSKSNWAVRSIAKTYFPMALRIISGANISSSCERGLMSYLIALQRSKIWALEMLDATAKIPSGLLRGTVMDFGEFDECLGIRVPELSGNPSNVKEKFRGRYCTIQMVPDILYSAAKRLEESNYTDSYGEPPELVKHLFNKLGRKLQYIKNFFGICIPSSCSEIDVQRISSAFLKPIGITSTVMDCQIDKPYVWPLYSAVALSALVVLAAICCLGTALDIMKRMHKPDNNDKEADTTFKVLKAFSVLTNSEKVMQSNTGSSSLSFLNGVRFLSATWIILGHCYVFTDMYKIYNRRNLMNFFDFSNLAYRVIDNFILAVDTFFFISGFLLVYNTWRQMDKNEGKVNLLKFFINKYLRMTPAIGLGMTLLMIMPTINSGPLWCSTLNPIIKNCQTSWWANFLYIHNFIDSHDMCLDYTWYLSVLMQLHVIGIVILMVFYRIRPLGIFLGLLLTGISSGVLLFQVLWENFDFQTLDAATNIDIAYEYGTKIYTKPHLHFPCYLIGMIVAYLLLKYNDKKLCRKHRILGWCCAVLLAVFSVYGPSFSDGSKAYLAFYHVTQRPAWALGFGWLTYMCCTGYGGLVNRLLSHRIMHPLGQLSYMIYIFHPLILIYKGSSQRERIFFGQNEQVFMFFSLLVPSIFLAFIGCVTVEIPFQNLQKMIFKGTAKVAEAENKRTEECKQ